MQLFKTKTDRYFKEKRDYMMDEWKDVSVSLPPSAQREVCYFGQHLIVIVRTTAGHAQCALCTTVLHDVVKAYAP